MQIWLLLGYHSKSGYKVVDLIKHKTLFGIQKPVRARYLGTAATETGFLGVIFLGMNIFTLLVRPGGFCLCRSEFSAPAIISIDPDRAGDRANTLPNKAIKKW